MELKWKIFEHLLKVPEIAVCVALLLLPPLSAHGAEVDAIYIRAKGGASFYTGADPISSAVPSLGLDLGYSLGNGYGASVMSQWNLTGSGEITSLTMPSTTEYTELKTFFLGVAPSYSVVKDRATLTFALAGGVWMESSHLVVRSQGSESDSSKSRFAVAPSIDVDVNMGAGVFANLGVKYIFTFGDSPRPGVLSPMAGIGYRF